jgi:hypothetical protein
VVEGACLDDALVEHLPGELGDLGGDPQRLEAGLRLLLGVEPSLQRPPQLRVRADLPASPG